MESLFVYGTLKSPEVQEAVTGRRLTPRPGRLHGYRLDTLRVRAGVYPIIEEADGEVIDGLVLEVSDEDLQRLDEYEGDEYRRRRVVLESGEATWAYTR